MGSRPARTIAARRARRGDRWRRCRLHRQCPTRLACSKLVYTNDAATRSMLWIQNAYNVILVQEEERIAELQYQEMEAAFRAELGKS